MLSQQYRMHPSISWFPSMNFYSGKLLDGDSVADRRLDPEIEVLAERFPRVMFFDLLDSSESQNHTNSKRNIFEANFTQELVKYFELLVNQLREKDNKDSEERSLKDRIGIVTPYKAHIKFY